MPRIRIVAIPHGFRIPREIRKHWVGLEIDAKGPVKAEAIKSFWKAMLRLPGGTFTNEFYSVDYLDGIQALTSKGAEVAAKWYEDNWPPLVPKALRTVLKNRLNDPKLDEGTKQQGLRALAFAFKKKDCQEM